MIYTKMINKALKIAYRVHKEQTDLSGVPYIFHPFTIAMEMDTEEEIITALLHDVIEDSDTDIEYLINEGFSEEIIEALKLLTKDKKKPYFDYIRRLKTNKLAAKVKLADLKHNSDITRLNEVDKNTEERIEKYKESIKILME